MLRMRRFLVVQKMASRMLTDHEYWRRAAKNAVTEWLIAKHPEERAGEAPGDYWGYDDLVLDPGNIGVYINLFSNAISALEQERHLTGQAFHDARTGVFSAGAVVLVGPDEYGARVLADRLRAREWSLANVSVTVGYLRSDGKFVEVASYDWSWS